MGEKTLEQISFEMGNIMLSEPAALDCKLRDIVHKLAGCLGAGNCSIMLINYDDMTVEVRAATNPAVVGFSRNLSDVTISTRAILDNEPFHVGSGGRSFFDELDATKYRSEYSISIPIRHFDKRLGVVNFTDFSDTGAVDPGAERRAVELIKHFAAYLYAVLSREQLEKKVARLEESNSELRELNDMKTSLTGFIIHDLKGPISTIVANLDMMGYDPLTPEQAECLSLATEDIFRMQNMVMDMLDVMKMEEGAVAIYREDHDIRSLIEREAAQFANLLARRNMRIEIDAVSRSIYIDGDLIGRVLVNLLRNAVYHAPEGSLITAAAWYNAESREVVVSVSDQGKGIPPEMRERIFEKYCRLGNGGGMGKGSGMGLTFCKLIVEAHGGFIWVEDADTGGARFVFTLPEMLP
jgi:two-component system sensor histidine kinase KdpD